MVQYGKGEIVYRAARSNSGNGGQIHKTQDCKRFVNSGVNPSNIQEKPLPSFPDWIPRCEWCFEDG